MHDDQGASGSSEHRDEAPSAPERAPAEVPKVQIDDLVREMCSRLDVPMDRVCEITVTPGSATVKRYVDDPDRPGCILRIVDGEAATTSRTVRIDC